VPELAEVEAYRSIAERALGRTIATVDARDEWFIRRTPGAAALESLLQGAAFVNARRRGKLLVLDTDGGPALGLRFGMTGRLIVDDIAGVDELLYSSRRDDPAFDRFAVLFSDGGHMRMADPRRLGSVEPDPSLDDLGPDALTLTTRQLSAALEASPVALKARLMDQRRIAGVGNLTADEVLWRASLSPLRASGDLAADEVVRLAREVRATLRMMIRRGGSHTGDLMAARTRVGPCPRDGEPLRRDQVGGRTTYWCSRHQR
jgi:formamidopyrimidine-DNA glycosylase